MIISIIYLRSKANGSEENFEEIKNIFMKSINNFRIREKMPHSHFFSLGCFGNYGKIKENFLNFKKDFIHNDDSIIS